MLYLDVRVLRDTALGALRMRNKDFRFSDLQMATSFYI